MEVEIVKFFQKISNSFHDVFFELITRMGEETFFLIIFAGLYICYNKFFAVKYTFYYLISVGINSLVKGIIRRPRPYEISSEIINRLPASNYSFPSGHTQGYFVQATMIMNEINVKSEREKLKITSLVCLSIFGLFVMISRLYWGQHFATDVIAGMMFGLTIPFVLDFLIGLIPKEWKNKLTEERIFFIIGVLCLIVTSVFIALEIGINFSSRKVYKFLGVLLAMSVGYFVDLKFIKYQPNQGWMWGIIKFFISTIVLVGMYLLLTLFIPVKGYFCFLVYFILGIMATIVLPLIFKLLIIVQFLKKK